MANYPRYQQLAFALGFALVTFVLLSVILLIWTLNTGNIELILSPWITYFAVGFACFLSGRRYKMSIYIAVFVAYIFFWLTLTITNYNVALIAWENSFLTLLSLIFIAPWTVIISAIGGTILGRVINKQNLKH